MCGDDQLSFHVDSKEDIRCYFFVHGQWTRFQAKDIKLLLPLFFVESDENKAFVKSKRIDQLIDEMDGLLTGMIRCVISIISRAHSPETMDFDLD